VRERVFIIGTDYRYRYANQRVIEFEGWDAAEIIGRHVIDLVGPLIFKRLVKPRLDRCFLGENVSFQHWVTPRSGKRQYIDVLLAPFREWDGAINGAIVTIRDKTAQKVLQDRLRDQDDLHRRLVENSLAGIAILQDGKIAFANQAIASMFGYDTVDEVLAKVDPFVFVAPHDRERVQSYENGHREEDSGDNQYEFDGLRQDGSIIHALASANRVLWQGKSAYQLLVVDITKQTKAERTLKATAASFQNVVEGSLQGFFVTQGENFVHINQAFIDLLGYVEDELKASPTLNVYAPHEHERMAAYRRCRLSGTKAPEVYEVDAIHKDGHTLRLQQCVRRVDDWFGGVAILGFVIDVTGQHLAEQAQQKEHNLLRAIIDNIPALVFAKDKDSRFLIKNKAGATFVGEPVPDDLIGKSNADYYPTDLVNRFRANELHVMATGEPLVDDERDVPCPATGLMTPMSGCIAPLLDADDDVIGIVGFSHDISKHRQSEAALRESEQRFKDIAEVTSDWFWEMDAELRFSYFSERVFEITGTDIEATLGKKRSDLNIVMNEEFRRHFDDLENRRPFRNFRYVKRGDDSNIHHVSISGVPMFDRDGQFTGYRGAGTNITKEVKAQQALANERNLLRAIIDNIPDAIFAKDREARFILKNRYDAVAMGAATPEETIGKSDFDYFSKTVAEELYQDDLQVMETGAPIINKVEQLVINEDGEPVWYSTTKMPLRDDHGEIMGLVGIGRDITEEKRLSDRLRYQASHDWLTGLLNRREFECCLDRALRATKSDHRSRILSYIDLDQFKMLNDSAGHIAGDQLLRQLADLFKEHAADMGATLARLGGDEFGLLIEDCELEQAEQSVGELIDAVNSMRFSIGQQSFSMSISVGLTVISDSMRDVGDLLARADIACYAAKDNGRNRLCIYHPDDQETLERHNELVRAARLKQAIEDDRLLLVAQPIIRLNDENSSISHYEILLRLKDKDDELLLPGAFIPAAERYGLMSMIDRWVVRNALKMLKNTASSVDGRRFNINLSGHSLADGDFQVELRQMLTETTIPTESLCIEITETAVISNLGRAKHFVGELRKMGCRIALDDFGCGLSSFSYLKHFPVDYIKIDGSFIKHIAEDQADRAIVKAINHVGHVCNIETVAECVEDKALLGPLRDLKVDYAQGLAIGPPMPLSSIVLNLEATV